VYVAVGRRNEGAGIAVFRLEHLYVQTASRHGTGVSDVGRHMFPSEFDPINHKGGGSSREGDDFFMIGLPGSRRLKGDLKLPGVNQLVPFSLNGDLLILIEREFNGGTFNPIA
jgi:hypothetical protein